MLQKENRIVDIAVPRLTIEITIVQTIVLTIVLTNGHMGRKNVHMITNRSLTLITRNEVVIKIKSNRQHLATKVTIEIMSVIPSAMLEIHSTKTMLKLSLGESRIILARKPRNFGRWLSNNREVFSAPSVVSTGTTLKSVPILVLCASSALILAIVVKCVHLETIKVSPQLFIGQILLCYQRLR